MTFATASQYGGKFYLTSTATTGTFTGLRMRSQTEAASGTPGVQSVLAQGSVAAAGYGGEIVGIRAEGIAKAGATVGTSLYGAYLKVEDERGTASGDASVYSGHVAMLGLYGQISADPTTGYFGIFLDAHSAVTGTSQVLDSVLYLPSEGQTNNTKALVQTAATISTLGSTSTKVLSSGSLTDSAAADVACDARIRVNIGGTSYWIPLFDTAA